MRLSAWEAATNSMPPTDVAGAGTDATAATTAGVAVEPAMVVADGILAAADTTDGVAVADVPSDGTVSVNPIRAVAEIVPEAVKFAADVALPLTSVR
ncbi:hypothetical protein [Nonomuraea sp. NPDC049129]|uniref:hypothetical protein n=1 Tax=Nonomuraea sp. NPDC049129 TaxID=3155272 RepID=UPI0033E55B4B